MLLTEIDTNIYRFENQTFYNEKVETYLINLSDKAILFDLPTYSSEIESYLRSLNKPLLGILSHAPCGIQDGQVWQRNLNLRIYLHESDLGNEWLSLKPDSTFINPPHIDNAIELIHTPGHTPGSICMLHKDSKCLFSGDTFSGNANGSVRNFLKDPDANGNLQLRLKSCKRLLALNFEKVLPFHYEMILNKAKDSLKNFLEESAN